MRRPLIHTTPWRNQQLLFGRRRKKSAFIHPITALTIVAFLILGPLVVVNVRFLLRRDGVVKEKGTKMIIGGGAVKEKKIGP